MSDEEFDRRLNNRRIHAAEMWKISTSLLSHKDREVRDLAIYSIALMRECFPKDMIAKFEGK